MCVQEANGWERHSKKRLEIRKKKDGTSDDNSDVRNGGSGLFFNMTANTQQNFNEKSVIDRLYDKFKKFVTRVRNYLGKYLSSRLKLKV